MKHGDKTKGKASKASGKKASKASTSGSKARPAASQKHQKQQHQQQVHSAKASVPAKGGNGKNKGRSGNGETVSISNPIVAAAFKRAIKKYPNAFRRLTD